MAQLNLGAETIGLRSASGLVYLAETGCDRCGHNRSLHSGESS